MKKLNKNQKGFTLVEIIVVLVILAILAAATIPTMLGFVDDAEGKAEVANARACYVAAQAIATETFATSTAADSDAKDAACEAAINFAADGTPATVKTKIGNLTGITFVSNSTLTADVQGGKVSSIIYYNGSKTVTITAGGSGVIS